MIEILIMKVIKLTLTNIVIMTEIMIMKIKIIIIKVKLITITITAMIPISIIKTTSAIEMNTIMLAKDLTRRPALILVITRVNIKQRRREAPRLGPNQKYLRRSHQPRLS